MANSLSEALNSPNFVKLSPDAKRYVFKKYSENDKDYNALSDEAKIYVQNKYKIPEAREYELEEPPLTPDTEKGSEALKKIREEGRVKDASVMAKVDKGVSKVFGEEVSPNADFSERAMRVLEAGVGGMAVGGSVGAGLGFIGGPGAPLTVPAGAAAGATVGFFSGAIGETAGQIEASFGGGRTSQVVTELLAGSLGGPAAQLGRGAANITQEAIKALVNPRSTLGRLGSLIFPQQAAEASQSLATSELRKAADAAARQKLLGESKGTGEKVGEALKTSVQKEAADEQQKVIQRQQRAAELAARAEKGKAGEVTALRRQQELADRELTLAKEQGAGTTESPFNFGTKLREAIQGVRNPIAKKASEAYGAAKNAVMETAAKNEANGVFWGKEAGAREVEQKWRAKAKKLDKATQKAINDVLDDIWIQIPVKKKGKVVGYREEFRSAEGIDNIVRKLGDVGYAHETEGYKAIGADIARELRGDITKGIADKAGNRKGGFYDWSGLGNAKGNYAKSLEELETFKTARGESALGTKEVDVGTLGKKFFGSEDGFKEVESMLGDKAKVKEFATQYAKNELAGKDKEGVRKWMRENSFLADSVPEVRSLAEKQMNKLSSLENKALVLKDRLSQAGEKTWSANVDKLAQKWVAEVEQKYKQIANELGLTGYAGLETNSNEIVGNMLNTDVNAQQLKATAKYLTDNPAIRRKFPDAVAEWLSSQPTSSIAGKFEKLIPALEGSGMIDRQGIKALQAGVDEIVAASKKIAPRGAPIVDRAKEEATARFKQLIKSSFGRKTAAGGVVGGKLTTSVMNREED